MVLHYYLGTRDSCVTNFARMVIKLLRASTFFSEEADKMHTLNPTPTCTRFDAAHRACSECGEQMRLVLAEPYKPESTLELRTFECAACGNGESYLIHL